MEKPAAASDLERRKQVRISLRRDLDIAPQKYEGRTFFVVKDPVSLRYYRFKDQEHFLLDYMDGKHTLDDAQKAFEKRFRPDRLTLEDLEQFAQQLLTAGLAQNESPQAGKQLFDRRKKRRRQEWMQTLTNILYIKIPVFDPDKLLTGMLRYLWWIFTVPFLLVSVGVMLAAVMLVATHFESFRDKLPSYHEFFSFKTVVYLWVALGAVKIIHEFGHGLSCKAFGGEVHEMGLLFLCLSPCLYCNVSDAWTLPNKWKRIIISGAGIYVELIIAAFATFLWWNTPTHPFINNLSLSLMIVCSVSTVVFNANPLMRYDGYYVLLDWLEIPNLRDRSNRFLQNVVLEHCLGVEVQPEPYMALGRKVLFISYAIVSWIYRWVVTFSILYMMHTFLRPYKLGVISDFMAMFAAGSMAGWPLYRLGKNLHRRGRVPDMKSMRVALSASVVVAVILVFFLVPLPVSRVRQLALVELEPESNHKVFMHVPAILEELKVRDGQHVSKDQELARFSSRDIDTELLDAETQLKIRAEQLKSIPSQLEGTRDEQEKQRIRLNEATLYGEQKAYATRVEVLKKKKELLVLKAPEDGIVMSCPKPEEIGKLWDKAEDKAFCTIGDPTKLQVLMPVTNSDMSLLREDETEEVFVRRSGVLSEVKVQVGQNVHQGDTLAVFGGDSAGQKKEELKAPVDGVVGTLPAADEVGKMWDRGSKTPFCTIEKDLEVTMRVHGRDWHTWRGQLAPLPEQDAKEVPQQLTNKAGGPLAVKPGSRPGQFVPQGQVYLVHVHFVFDPQHTSKAVYPGTLAQVKIHCRWRTAAWWVYRTVSSTFDLRLM
jgi:putative peptide zinc metalloprotease protein